MMELREKGEEEEEREEGIVQQTLAGQRLPSVARARTQPQLVIAPGTECPRISGEGDTASGLLITAHGRESGRTELEAQFRIRLIMGHGPWIPKN